MTLFQRSEQGREERQPEVPRVQIQGDEAVIPRSDEAPPERGRPPQALPQDLGVSSVGDGVVMRRPLPPSTPSSAVRLLKTTIACGTKLAVPSSRMLLQKTEERG